MPDPLALPELLTPAEMSKADRFAISAGTTGIALMERAGLAVSDEAARLTKSRGRIAILCGPGGNGGDGFIAGRLLSRRGFAVELGLIGRRDALKGDPALAAARYQGPVLAAAALDLAEADCVIDALFGAGLTRDIDGEAKAIIERINAFSHAGGRVLAVDVPSGIDGETGRIRGLAVEASASVTFFRLKPGHLLEPGRRLAGAIRLADIGIPEAALGPIVPKTFVNTPAIWGEALPRPNAASHKYARGAALILSGSGHHTGAARLAARAALRAGAGIVSVASPPDAVAVNSAHLTAVMVALGPGAGVGPTLRKLVAAALTRPAKQRTIVLDADALTSFAGAAARLAALIKRGGHQVVMTPHEGEFAKLFEGMAEVRLDDDKLTRARAAARLMGAVVLVKGADTVVAAPDGRATIGWDLPPWLATAGSGDVLAGLVTGLAAQDMPAFEAASAAVWLHGACGRVVGPGLIAEDLADALPQVLRALG
jgi:hydroxyethylthiazole kinase-like uncharacterized protein yjeF